jgi:hypothetical protein
MRLTSCAGLLWAVGLLGCGAPEEAAEDDAEANEVVFAEGSREARAAVAFVNDASTDAARLKAAGVTTNTTANAIVKKRDGADGLAGTGDDAPFVTLGEIDAVKGIGPVTVKSLAAFAIARDFGNERGLYHGVYFTEAQADRLLTLANTASIAELDARTSVDSRALKNIEAARPVVSMAELTSLSRVKKTALAALRAEADEALGPLTCTHEEPCPGDLYCTSDVNLGYCIDTTPVAGEGDPCDAEGVCGPDLVCGGRQADFEGICVAAWMHDEFVSEGPPAAIADGPDGGISVDLRAIGMATVPTDAILRVSISHPRPDDLVLTLENTSGTVVPVWDPSMGPLPTALEDIIVDVPGDESANGMWVLSAFDTVAGETGTIEFFTLELTSRWD